MRRSLLRNSSDRKRVAHLFSKTEKSKICGRHGTFFYVVRPNEKYVVLPRPWPHHGLYSPLSHCFSGLVWQLTLATFGSLHQSRPSGRDLMDSPAA